MNVLVLGGSNSLLRGGYLSRALAILGNNVASPVIVRNLSVGGTTTITAIARLFDLPTDYAPDLVVYEYAVNDAAHFKPRKRGAEIQLLVLRLLIETLAARFPDALFAPLLFGMKPYFAARSKNPIYALQSRIWADAGISCLDARERLAYLFANAAPDWLYGDDAHYRVPHGADIVGAMVGRFLVEVERGAPRNALGELARRMRETHGAPPFTVRSVSAADLSRNVSGDWELVTRANRLMSTPALRLHPGAVMTLPLRLLNLAILSDRRHDVVSLTRRAGEDAVHHNLSTRFLSVDNPVANPPEMDRFFYCGIAFPLLDLSASIEIEQAQFEIAVPEAPDPSLPLLAFDTFVRRPPPVEGRRLDIVGCLTLEP